MGSRRHEAKAWLPRSRNFQQVRKDLWGGSSDFIQLFMPVTCQWERPSTVFLICKVGTAYTCLGWSLVAYIRHLVEKRSGIEGNNTVL